MPLMTITQVTSGKFLTVCPLTCLHFQCSSSLEVWHVTVLVEDKGVLVTGFPLYSWPTAFMSKIYRVCSLLLWASLWRSRTRKDWWGGKYMERKLRSSTRVASFVLLLGIVLHMDLLAKPLQGCWDCPASSDGKGPWGYSTPEEDVLSIWPPFTGRQAQASGRFPLATFLTREGLLIFSFPPIFNDSLSFGHCWIWARCRQGLSFNKICCILDSLLSLILHQQSHTFGKDILHLCFCVTRFSAVTLLPWTQTPITLQECGLFCLWISHHGDGYLCYFMWVFSKG